MKNSGIFVVVAIVLAVLAFVSCDQTTDGRPLAEADVASKIREVANDMDENPGKYGDWEKQTPSDGSTSWNIKDGKTYMRNDRNGHSFSISIITYLFGDVVSTISAKANWDGKDHLVQVDIQHNEGGSDLVKYRIDPPAGEWREL